MKHAGPAAQLKSRQDRAARPRQAKVLSREPGRTAMDSTLGRHPAGSLLLEAVRPADVRAITATARATNQ